MTSPGGSATKEFIPRTLGEFPTEAAFNELIVAYRQGNAIRTKDLGYAERDRAVLSQYRLGSGPTVFIILFFLALLVGGIFFKILGNKFVTSEDRSKFLIRQEDPLSYSISKTDSVMKQVEKILQEMPEAKSYFTINGYSGGEVVEANKGISFVNLVPENERDKSQLQSMTEVRGKMKVIPDLKGMVSEISSLGGRF